jgi:ABC-2 type transport system ATP-binding protein
MTGGIEDVVRAYEGEDAARHVREVLEEHRGDWSPTSDYSADWPATVPDD